MTAVLAHIHRALAAVDEDADLDMDPALRACVQLALAGPHLVPPPESAPPPLTVSALGMHQHAVTTVDGQGPQAPRTRSAATSSDRRSPATPKLKRFETDR